MNTFLFRLKPFVLTILVISFISSCVEDDPLPIPGEPPTSTILNTTSDTTLTSTSLSDNVITLTALNGSSPLESLTITKNGASNFLDTISIDGIIYEKEIDLSGTDKTSFSFNISFSIIRGEGAVFTFSILAENGDSRSQTLTLNITPELKLPSGSGDQLCEAGSLKTLEFIGLEGTTPLYSVGVFQDTSRLDISRLTFGDVPATTNPILLNNDQLLGFTENLALRTHTLTDTSFTYRFVLTDADNLENTISILIQTTP